MSAVKSVFRDVDGTDKFAERAFQRYLIFVIPAMIQGELTGKAMRAIVLEILMDAVLPASEILNIAALTGLPGNAEAGYKLCMRTQVQEQLIVEFYSK